MSSSSSSTFCCRTLQINRIVNFRAKNEKQENEIESGEKAKKAYREKENKQINNTLEDLMRKER